jgi:hypothetical protein
MNALWSAVIAIAFASGLNIYATVLTLGLLGRFEVVELPGHLTALSSTLVLAVALFLFIVEFVADKVPYVDSAWDVLHSFIRPVGGAVLAYSAVADVDPQWQVAAALIGGGVALTSHAAKASARAAANLSPEPFSNWTLSFLEDILAIGVVWLATSHPWLALGVVIVLIALAAYIVVKFSRLIRWLFWGPRRGRNAA